MIACLPGEDVDLGRNIEASASELVDASAGGDSQAIGAPTTPGVLTAGISAQRGTICAGDCVDLLATALGGQGPFAYSWGQDLGQGRGPKTVCPLASTTYSVMVSSLTSEQQATASLPITVVACDAGTMPAQGDAGITAPGPDSGASPARSTALCVPNPSLEGPPTIGMTGPPGTTPTGAPPQWQVCKGAPDVNPSLCLVPPAAGTSYEGMAVGTGSLAYMTASIGTTLCSPLVAGTLYSFCLDLGIGVRGVMAPLTTGAPAPALQIWGGLTPCNQDALLWTSPPITNTDSWTEVCGTFVATQALSTISLLPSEGASPIGPGTWSYVIADDIVAGP